MAVALALLAALVAPSLLAASGERLAGGDEPSGAAQAEPEEDGEAIAPAPEPVEDAGEAAPPVAEASPSPDPREGGEAVAGSAGDGERPVSEPAATAPGSKPRASRERRRARAAQALASGAVDIRNFAYAPREITVSVGEAVRWTNRDREPHDAEAFDGSFKTSVLDRGESDSVTFPNAGTFRYFCSIHPPSQFPNFTGTVRVLGSGGGAAGGEGGDPATAAGAGGGGQAGEGAGTGSRGAVAGRSGTLPATGLALIPLLAAGLVLLSTGGFLRRLRSAG